MIALCARFERPDQCGHLARLQAWFGFAPDAASRNVLMSQAAFAELCGVLGRTRFRQYIDKEDADLFLDSLAREVVWIEVDVEMRVCRDQKDDMLLSLAVSGGASHLVTGDKDLLVLDPFRGIRILTPHAFLNSA